MLSLEKAGLPPSLLASVKHLACLHNPTFYERQKLRLSTYQTPRFIKCYQEDLSHLHLPRGVLEQLRSLLGHAGSDVVVTDHRPSLAPLSLRFHGRLTALQATAVDTMLGHDHGVLVAPPGTGKTIMGAAIIAARNLPTLVLVHRKPLLDQWRVQLVETLGLSSNQVGQIGGGKNKPTGMVDLAMIQSLSRLDNPEGLFQRYGAIVIDECHHLPAFSFESCVRRAPARHVLGLTATPYRRDGLQGIITMQCGPIRHTISPRDAEPDAPRPHLRVRATDFGLEESDDASIQEVFRALVNDQQRTALVCEDVLAALSQRRRCLVLSQWKDHVHLIAEQLRANGKEPFVLEGGLGKKAREAILADVQHIPADQDLILIATGQYLGEGFDCPSWTRCSSPSGGLQGKARPVHRPAAPSVSGKADRRGVRLRRHRRPRARGHARQAPQDLPVARLRRSGRRTLIFGDRSAPADPYGLVNCARLRRHRPWAAPRPITHRRRPTPRWISLSVAARDSVGVCRATRKTTIPRCRGRVAARIAAVQVCRH